MEQNIEDVINSFIEVKSKLCLANYHLRETKGTILKIDAKQKCVKFFNTNIS